MIKSILNTYVEKIYVITCFESYERLNTNAFITDDFELIVAPKQTYFTSVSEDYCAGAVSLASANESIILKSKLKGYKSICIIEDDIYPSENYIEKVQNFFNSVDNWDILNLGYHAHSTVNGLNTDDVYHRVTADDDITGTHCMVYKHTVYDYLLNLYNDNTNPIDWMLSKNVYTKFKSYIPTDKIFYCSSYREKEADRNESYKQFESVITMHI